MSNELSQIEVENRIFSFRSVQVMIDRDLAETYQVQTKVLNQAVKRNIDRFPKPFRFQLSDEEVQQLVTNCDRFDFAISNMNAETLGVLENLKLLGYEE